jgi:hypothetical protein
MEWQDGDIWSATLPLSPGLHEFKLVVAAADSSSSIWEGGNNRTVTVPSPATTGGSSYIAECHWNNPETVMRPGGPEGVSTYDDGDDKDTTTSNDETVSGTGSQTVGKMTIENADDDDDEEKEVGKMTIGKMTVEGGGEESTSEVEVGKMTIGKMTVEGQDTSTTTTVGKMTMDGGVVVKDDLIDSGIGAEEGKSAAAAMTPDTALAMASGDEDSLESPFAKAISGLLQNLGLGNKVVDDNDDDSNTPGGSGSNSKGSENKPSGGSPSSGSSPPGAGPSSFKFTAAAAAAVVFTMSSTTATAAMPMMALPRQFFRGPRY